jgi:hypothetical protein
MRRRGAASTLALCALSLSACQDGPRRGPDEIVAPPGDCSDLSRPLFDFYQPEGPACGPRLPPLREIVPVGQGAFLLFQPASGYAQLWKPAPGGYSPVAWVLRSLELINNTIATWAFDDRVLSLHGKNGDLTLWKADLDAVVGAPLLRQQSTSIFGQTVLQREILVLDPDHVLVWFPGDGRFAVHQLDRLAGTNVVPLDVAPLVAGTHARFLRGHELVALDPTRILEWEPRTGDYRVWGVSLEGGVADPFSQGPLVQGTLPSLVRDLPAGRDVLLMLLKQGQLLVWNRAVGEISVIDFDAGVRDPLAEAPRLLAVSEGLRSLPRGFEPPVRSAISRVLIVLQRGRSFDFYFGRACQAPTGTVAACTDGGFACCDAIPETTTNAAACFPFDPANDDVVVDETPACLADKINNGAMDRFVSSTIPGCGDAHAFSCVEAVKSGYARLAARGALADRFFQSTAKNSGQMNLAESNFMYLAFGSHRIGATSDQSGESINGRFAHRGIPWVVYLHDPIKGLLGQKAPLFYDGHWGHFRFFEELERDIHEERLAPVSIVLAPPELSEQPGAGPPAAGAAFVERLLADLEASPRLRNDTLVLVTHLTAGGFYDHVPPPPDDTDELPPQPYGPRVPLLAFGPFVTAGHVSHAPMELSSLTAFLEWNWLPEGSSLGGRDRRANNIGSLLNATAARDGEPVPAGPNPRGP